MYPTAVADEVAPALEKQALSEMHLQRAIGHDTMNCLWDDPFTAEALKRTRAHEEDLHLSRIFAEESEEHLYHARELSEISRTSVICSSIASCLTMPG